MSRSILVPLDGSATAEQALPHAAMLARLLDAGIILARVPETVIVPVMSAGIWITEEVEPPEAHAHAEDYLAEVARRDVLAGLVIQTIVPSHPVAAGIVHAIEMTTPDLVVMTTHGRSGVRRWVLGSVADKVVHAAPAPVYLVRAVEDEAAATTPAPIQRILVPLDGSMAGEAALPPAIDLARRTGARVVLVRVPVVPGYATVIPETAGWIPQLLGEKGIEATAYLESVAEALDTQGIGADIDVEVVAAGGVADGIVASSQEWEADVIVMSTHGRTGLRRWMLGSVADGVLHHADRPVWLVRGQPGPG